MICASSFAETLSVRFPGLVSIRFDSRSLPWEGTAEDINFVCDLTVTLSNAEREDLVSLNCDVPSRESDSAFAKFA